MRVTDEMVEAAARAQCAHAGFDPDEIMSNDGPRWQYYVPGSRAALKAALAVEGTEAEPACRNGDHHWPFRALSEWKSHSGGQKPAELGEQLVEVIRRGPDADYWWIAEAHHIDWPHDGGVEDVLCWRLTERIDDYTTLPAGIREALEVIESFIAETVDYATRNNLGDPEKQHNVKWGRKVLAALRGQS